jgi:hypothetical protein
VVPAVTFAAKKYAIAKQKILRFTSLKLCKASFASLNLHKAITAQPAPRAIGARVLQPTTA